MCPSFKNILFLITHLLKKTDILQITINGAGLPKLGLKFEMMLLIENLDF